MLYEVITLLEHRHEEFVGRPRVGGALQDDQHVPVDVFRHLLRGGHDVGEIRVFRLPKRRGNADVDGRINSYNVCYTKLLRIQDAPVEGRRHLRAPRSRSPDHFRDVPRAVLRISRVDTLRGEGKEDVLAHREPLLLEHRHEKFVGRPRIRITSYNVCYTKLLRRMRT